MIEHFSLIDSDEDELDDVVEVYVQSRILRVTPLFPVERDQELRLMTCILPHRSL